MADKDVISFVVIGSSTTILDKLKFRALVLSIFLHVPSLTVTSGLCLPVDSTTGCLSTFTAAI